MLFCPLLWLIPVECCGASLSARSLSMRVDYRPSWSQPAMAQTPAIGICVRPVSVATKTDDEAVSDRRLGFNSLSYEYMYACQRD